MDPRPYQLECIERVLAGFAEFHKQLVVVPTGGGKTLIFSWLAQRVLPRRTLILAHREELIDQAIGKMQAATGIVAGREKAESSASLEDSVVVASVQSMIRRLDRWPSDHFGLVVIDEAHHALAKTYLRILQHFDQHAWILGVTATPDRGDKRNLGAYFESIPTEIGLFDLIHQGYLCPISLKSIPLKIDLSGVEVSAGDFREDQLGDALEPYLEQIAQSIARESMFRRVLCFVPLIATSKKFVEHLRAAGAVAEHIDGTSPDRAEILERFSAGEFDVLSNAMLLTEGYDHPAIDCIAMLRPTKSRALFSQCCGRGTRISPGKQNLLLLDFLWLHEKHDLVRPANLVAHTQDLAVEMTKAAEAGGQGALDLEGLMSETQANRERKLAEELALKAKRRAKTLDATEFALALHATAAVEYEPVMKWEQKPVSDAQASVLQRAGIDLESVTCMGHASKIIDLVISRSRMNLCTPKQMRMLKRLGHPFPERATFEQARVFLDQRLGSKKPKEDVPF